MTMCLTLRSGADRWYDARVEIKLDFDILLLIQYFVSYYPADH